MALSFSRKTLLPLLLFSLIWPALEFSLAGPAPARPAGGAQLPEGWKTYRHAGVPFEFSYPDDLLLDAHVNPKLGFVFALMKKPGTPWLVDIGLEDRAEYSMDPYNKMSLEEFAVARAQAACQVQHAVTTGGALFRPYALFGGTTEKSSIYARVNHGVLPQIGNEIRPHATGHCDNCIVFIRPVIEAVNVFLVALPLDGILVHAHLLALLLEGHAKLGCQ